MKKLVLLLSLLLAGTVMPQHRSLPLWMLLIQTSAGSVSVEAAFEVGGLIEEVDIEDLAIYIEATNAADIITAYEHLLSGSESHLRAFVSQLDRAGVEYQPTVLDTELYESIISAENERGGGGGRNGQGGRGGPNA